MHIVIDNDARVLGASRTLKSRYDRLLRSRPLRIRAQAYLVDDNDATVVGVFSEPCRP